MAEEKTSGIWDTTIFQCFSDIKALFFSTFCCPCQVAYQKAAVESKNCQFLDCCCGCCCSPQIRGQVRYKYNIPGGYCGDLLITCCCYPCAVSQQTRQLKLHGDKPSGICME